MEIIRLDPYLWRSMVEMRFLRRINPVGVAGGILAAIVLISSMVYKHYWWELIIGDNVGCLKASALNYELTILGTLVEVKILWFINLIFQLLFLESIISMLIYSFASNRGFSEKLLKFAYLKPLAILLLFLMALAILFLLLPSILLNTVFPVVGSYTLSIDYGNVSIEIPLTASFTKTFWLMVATTLLYLLAPIYHRKIVLKQ